MMYNICRELDRSSGSVRRYRVWRYATQVFLVSPFVLPGNPHVALQHVDYPDYRFIIHDEPIICREHLMQVPGGERSSF